MIGPDEPDVCPTCGGPLYGDVTWCRTCYGVAPGEDNGRRSFQPDDIVHVWLWTGEGVVIGCVRSVTEVGNILVSVEEYDEPILAHPSHVSFPPEQDGAS